MNIKKLLTTAVLGASLLSFAGIASADTYNINIWGASAQYKFWNFVAPNFIKAQTGCSDVTPAVATNGKNQITYADCGGNSYNIRVSSKASFDGVEAILGIDKDATSTGTSHEKCLSTDTGYPGASLAPYYRRMVERNGSLACESITIGASDVAGESFTQYSFGSLYGPADAGNTDIVERSFNSIHASSLPHANPFTVPFGFFIHNDVVVDSVPIDNLTRMQAVLLFSGQITNWQDFGPSYPDLPAVICLRHAGSGTHATLDYAVVRGNGWGNSLVQFENRPDAAGYTATLPKIYFNDGTGDLLACLENQAGSVGYADADQADFYTHAVSGKPHVVAIAYQGEYPSADALMNGRYDFWTNEWAYKNPTMVSALLSKVNNLLDFAGNQSMIPDEEQNYWVVQSAMTFEKATDQQYPHK